MSLCAFNVDVIVSTGEPPAARAAKAATKIIPVVFVSGGAVETGIVSNLARPGGNITGVEVFAEQLDDKRLEVLKEMLPQALRIAVLWNPATPEGERQRSRLLTAAQAVGVKTRFVGARHPSELQAAFGSITRDHVQALLVSNDPMFGGEAQRIVQWTTAARLPTIYFLRLFVDAGGLMSYGADIAASYGRAATYVDKILKGAKPGDLPVE
jgi:putative ABC transport system substrate-binding protein